MNMITIAIAGYVLLFFNFIILVILIKKKFKCQKVSSFYILSTSDILNSVVTAILLLINHADMNVSTNYFYKSKRMLNINIKDKYSDTFLQFYDTYNLTDINYSDLTICNIKNLLMHNAMFLMPFTNAFISLIILSIQCNLSATFISDKYNNYFQSEIKMEENPIKMSDNINHSEQHNIEIIEINDTSSTNEELIKSKDIYKNTTTMKMKEMIPQFFHDTKLKNISTTNKGIVGMSVLSQWLIPIVTTGILYFADYQNIGIMLQNENVNCMYESPFSFHNCLETNEDTKRKVSQEYSTISIPVYNDYVSNLSSIQLFDLNVTENEIISKIYNIMNSALNNTNDLENKNLLPIENNIDINNKTNPETNSKEWVTVDNLNSYNWSDIIVEHKNNFQMEDKRFEEQITKLLLPLNTSLIPFNVFDKNKMNNNLSHDNDLKDNKNETNSLVNDRNRAEETLLLTKEQILLDIVSRIKNSTTITNKKKGTKTKRSGQRYYNIESNDSTTEMTTLVNENYEDVDKLFEITATCTMDKCIIPIKFVRLYFFALMFIIYFLPIILSSVLQVRSQFICQNVLSKLKEKNTISYNTSHNSFLNTEYNNKETKYRCNHVQIYDSILKESLQVDKLIRTIKVSLIIGIILWTPIFLQTIFKVFLCINVSTWITDCTFLCAILNDILRSIFNLNIVTTEETPKVFNKKENTVHPSDT